jgi:hypothetical protein
MDEKVSKNIDVAILDESYVFVFFSCIFVRPSLMTVPLMQVGKTHTNYTSRKKPNKSRINKSTANTLVYYRINF